MNNFLKLRHGVFILFFVIIIFASHFMLQIELLYFLQILIKNQTEEVGNKAGELIITASTITIPSFPHWLPGDGLASYDSCNASHVQMFYYKTDICAVARHCAGSYDF